MLSKAHQLDLGILEVWGLSNMLDDVRTSSVSSAPQRPGEFLSSQTVRRFGASDSMCILVHATILLSYLGPKYGKEHIYTSQYPIMRMQNNTSEKAEGSRTREIMETWR